MQSRDSVRQLRSIDPVCWEGKCEYKNRKQ